VTTPRGHVADLTQLPADEEHRQVLAIREYGRRVPGLATRTAGHEDRSGTLQLSRQDGVIAINFREDDDEMIGQRGQQRHDIPARLPQGPVDQFHCRRPPSCVTMGRADLSDVLAAYEVPQTRIAALDVVIRCRAGSPRKSSTRVRC